MRDVLGRTTKMCGGHPSGVGAAKASIRVTSEDGNVVVVKDVPMESDASVKGSSNYQ